MYLSEHQLQTLEADEHVTDEMIGDMEMDALDSDMECGIHEPFAY